MRAALLSVLAASALFLCACDEVVDADHVPPPPVVERRSDSRAPQAPARQKPRFRRMSDAEVQNFIRKHENEVIIETEGVIRYRDWVAERQPSGDWIGYKP